MRRYCSVLACVLLFTLATFAGSQNDQQPAAVPDEKSDKQAESKDKEKQKKSDKDSEKKKDKKSDKKKKGDQYSELTFTVVKEDNGKPVRNASVILHPVNNDGKQESGGLQLKTDSEGTTAFNSVPYGKLRIQVLARGFQTFGQDFDISQAKHEIVIKLKRPQEQHTIYK